MWRRAAPAVLLAGLWLVATGPAAGAHAVLRGSDPAGGASVRRAPGTVTLRFSEAPDPGLSVVHVIDTSGREVSAGGTAPVAGSPLELRVPLGALGDGTYTVTWRAVSRMDGHVSRGAFAFGVGLPATAAPAPTRAAPAGDGLDAPSPLAVAARWSFYWGLALLVGAAATGLAVFDRRLPPRAARACRWGGCWNPARAAGWRPAAACCCWRPSPWVGCCSPARAPRPGPDRRAPRTPRPPAGWSRWAWRPPAGCWSTRLPATLRRRRRCAG